MISLGLIFWSSVAGWFWLGISREAVVRCSQGCMHLMGLTGPGGSTPEAVHSHGRLAGAAEWQGLLLLSTEHSHITAPGFPQSRRSESKEEAARL